MGQLSPGERPCGSRDRRPHIVGGAAHSLLETLRRLIRVAARLQRLGDEQHGVHARRPGHSRAGLGLQSADECRLVRGGHQGACLPVGKSQRRGHIARLCRQRVRAPEVTGRRDDLAE